MSNSATTWLIFGRLNLIHFPVRVFLHRIRAEQLAITNGWLFNFGAHSLSHRQNLLRDQSLLDKPHRRVVVIAWHCLVCEWILWELVHLLTACRQIRFGRVQRLRGRDSSPIRIVLEALLVADDPKHVARPSDRHIHPPIVLQEAKALRAHGRYDDYVLLSSLIAIHSVDLDVCITWNAKLVFDLADRSFELSDLRLVRRDDADGALEGRHVSGVVTGAADLPCEDEKQFPDKTHFILVLL